MDDIEFKAEKTISCPIATQDIPVNLKNRQNAIDNGGYGPLNPTQANNAFWKKKASRWNVTISESKKQTCGNCAAFIRTPRMLDCIDKGLGNEKGNTAWDVIDAGELGYCESFDFKCASARTCDAWIVGGPITKEKGKKQETKSLENFLSVEEGDAIEFVESLSNREFIALFPNEYTDEANDVKWLFDVSYDFADRLINSRHAGNFGYEEKGAPKGKSASEEDSLSFLDSKEAEFSDYIDSLDDDEFDANFPDDSDETVNEVKFLFGVGVAFGRRALMNRRKRRKKKETDGQFSTKGLGDGRLRDPKGGLTAAGRAHFNKTEGSNLKPGVKGPADTPEKMRRKGSFLVRFFTNPSGPMQDDKGKPTRLALSAAAWGEPVPKTAAAAAKLAAKGSRLLERYRNHKEAQKKKDAFGDIEIKAAAPATIGASGGRTIGQSNASRKPQTIGGRGGGSSSSENYNPNARDADGDGNVQEGTEFMRAAQPRTGTADSMERDANRSRTTDRRRGNAPPKDDSTDRRRRNAPPKDDSTDRRRRNAPRTRGASDSPANTTSRTWQTDTGSADTRERGIIREDLEKRGFDGEAFRKFIDAESRKLKPGQKTNWNPGRLPNGGKIAADGTYIPPDMVREDDKRVSDYYRNRRDEKKPNRPQGSADSMERQAETDERNRTGQGQGYDKINSQAEMDAYRASQGLPPVPFNPKPSNKPSNKPNTTKPSLLMPDLPKKPRTGWLSPYFAGDYADDESGY
jgi:hypothetical protein